jgi:hypothetical protein
MRLEEPLRELERVLGDALRSKSEATDATELHNVGAITVALLDDEPHANLDKKRTAAKQAYKLASVTAARAELSLHAASASERSFGLAPAVAKRLAAVILLSLRDTATEQASHSGNDV